MGWEEKGRHRATGNTSLARELSSSYLEVIMGCASLRSRYEYVVHSPKELRERWLKSIASYNHLGIRAQVSKQQGSRSGRDQGYTPKSGVLSEHITSTSSLWVQS